MAGGPVAPRYIEDWRGKPLRLADPTDAERAYARFLSSGPAAASLPIKLSGGLRLDSIDGICDRCGETCTETRGEVTHPFPHIARAELVGVCRPCRMLSPSSMRFVHRPGEKASLTILRRGQWVNLPVDALRQTFLDSILVGLEKLWHRFMR